MENYSFRNDPRILPWQRELLREFCSSLEGNIVKLANDLGLKILAEDLLPYERGYLENSPSFGSKSGWVIKLNKNDAPETQNFTAGHEIGHFVLHGARLAGLEKFDGRLNRNTAGGLDPFTYLEDKDKVLEFEANRFSTTLLMPPNQFRPAYSRLNGDLDALSRLFCVTRTAVSRRVRELRLDTQQ